ncbi:endonuclease [Aureococcus anophagefferens]|nr:endonuclease [Aureococcus anophagefferens]
MKRPYDAVAPPAARYPIAPGAPPPVYDAYAPASGANPCFEFLRSGSCRNGDRCKYVHGPAPEDGRLPKDGRCHAHFYLGGCHRGEACRYSHGGDHVGAFAIQAESVRETLEAGKRDRARPPPPPPADGDAVHDDEVYLRNVNYLYGSQQLARVMERAFKGRVLAVRLAPCADPARAGRRPLPRRQLLGPFGALRGARAAGEIDLGGRVAKICLSRMKAPDPLAGDRPGRGAPDAISYNAAIAACERAGDCDGALRLFASLKRRGLRPTAVSYNAAVAAALGGRWAAALECLGRMPGDGVPPDSVVYHAVVGACEAAGEGDAATAYAGRPRRRRSTRALWDADGAFLLPRVQGPDVAVAAARLALRDVVDEPETRPFFSLAGTVAALDPETGETYDAAGDDLVIRADCDASLAAVADLLRDAFPQLDAAPAKGAVAVTWASLREWKRTAPR